MEGTRGERGQLGTAPCGPGPELRGEDWVSRRARRRAGTASAASAAAWLTGLALPVCGRIPETHVEGDGSPPTEALQFGVSCRAGRASGAQVMTGGASPAPASHKSDGLCPPPDNIIAPESHQQPPVPVPWAQCHIFQSIW